MFCGGGGDGEGIGVSRFAILPLDHSGLPEKAPDGLCSLYCWLEGVLIPKTCSTILCHLKSCGLVAGRWSACAPAPYAAAACSAACCSWQKAACYSSCSVLRSSSESASWSPDWRRVPKLYGVDPAGPRAGEEGSGVGSCAGVCSVEHL